MNEIINLYNQETPENLRERLDSQKIYLEITQARLDLWNPLSQFSKNTLLGDKDKSIRIINYLESKINNTNKRIITEVNNVNKRQKRC